MKKPIQKGASNDMATHEVFVLGDLLPLVVGHAKAEGHPTEMVALACFLSLSTVLQAGEGNKPLLKTAAVTSALKRVTIQPGETVEQATTRILIATGADMNLDEAKRVKENYLALREQLEYDRTARLVVAVEDVCRAVGDEYAKVRSRLLAIPSEHAPRISRLKTAQEVQDALHGIIVDALEELTRDGDGLNKR